MWIVLGEFGSKDNVPQLGGDSVACILSAVVVLVVVSLQPSEIALRLSDMMQCIVDHIVANVPVYQSYPVDQAEISVCGKYEAIDSMVTDENEDSC